MEIKEFQALMKALFFDKDEQRGSMKTLAWLVEEVGELARELRHFDSGTLESPKKLEEEFADVLAWLSSLANIAGVDLESAALAKYPLACSKCGKNPCECDSG